MGGRDALPTAGGTPALLETEDRYEFKPENGLDFKPTMGRGYTAL
jgi:hypothetical protein